MNYTMKKLMPSFIISLVIVGISIFLYVLSFGSFDTFDSELSVTRHKMDITIEKNGSIYIKEDVDIELEMYWDYLIKDIGYSKDERVEQDLGFQIDNARSSFDEDSFKVEVYDEKGNQQFPMVRRNYDLNQGKYRSFELDSETRFNFDSGYKIHYEYRILNAVTVYNDIAELNWIFIDDLEYQTKNIEINVNLPLETSVDSIEFFGHGVSRDNALKQNGTNFKIKIDKLHSGELIEARILFDKNAVNEVDSSKVVYQDAKQAILDIENNIELEQNKLRTLYNTSVTIVIIIFVIMVAIVVYKTRKIYIKYDKERVSDFDSEYYRELPDTYSPAELGMLINFNELDKNELQATLMDLIRRKYIILDMNGCTTLDSSPNYKLILNNAMPHNELKEHEIKLLNWFFNKIGNGSQLTLDELDRYLKVEANAKKYLDDSKEWGYSVLKESKKNDFFDDVREAKRSAGIAYLLIMLVVIATFIAYSTVAFYEGLIIIAIAISIGLIFSKYISQIKRRSEKGNEDYVRWMAFKNFLLDFSQFDDYPIPSIVVWEHYLVYATEFGIAKTVEEQMRLKFKRMNLNFDEYIANDSSSYMRYNFSCYYFHRRIYATRMIARSTIQQAQAARAASRGSGGSRGGFGGGRSFGGGGGGMRGGR